MRCEIPLFGELRGFLYLSPSLTKPLREAPLLVAWAVPPRATINAVRTALFPPDAQQHISLVEVDNVNPSLRVEHILYDGTHSLPLLPTTKLTLEPKVKGPRRVWHMKFLRVMLSTMPASPSSAVIWSWAHKPPLICLTEHTYTWSLIQQGLTGTQVALLPPKTRKTRNLRPNEVFKALSPQA